MKKETLRTPTDLWVEEIYRKDQEWFDKMSGILRSHEPTTDRLDVDLTEAEKKAKKWLRPDLGEDNEDR